MSKDKAKKSEHEDRKGEGNPDADRRYRDGVRKTVDNTTAFERAERAREMTTTELEEAQEAEEEGKDHAKK